MRIAIAFSLFTASIVTAHLLLILNASAGTGAKHYDAKPPVVVELFTSQSCSSCPPADRLLGKLAQEDGIIALGYHVTYWDHLSWKDTLSDPAFTQRQYDYSEEAGRRNVFTPELIVNGRTSLIGSREGQVREAIEQARQDIVALQVQFDDAGRLRVDLPAFAKDQKQLTLSIIAYGPLHEQQIERGENAGRSVAYINPVRQIDQVNLPWSGEPKTVSLPVAAIDNVAGYAIFINMSNAVTGPILAAGRI